MRAIVHGENLEALRRLPASFARLVYVDPPFNTGKTQARDRIRVRRGEEGARRGFGGHAYEVERLESPSYEDRFDDYVPFVVERIREALRCVTLDGSIFVHVDPRESHYLKVALDGLLGRESFMNEIVWAYD